MNLNIESFEDFKIEELKPSNFIDEKRWEETTNKLKELKPFMDDMLRITKTTPNLPQHLVDLAANHINVFISYVAALTDNQGGSPADIVRNKESILKRINEWYLECLAKRNHSTEMLSFYDVFNTLHNLEKDNFETERIEIENHKKKILSDKDSIDKILKELQKKASEVIVSDYSRIFGKQSYWHNVSSWIWIGVGVLISLIFMYLLTFTNVYAKFPTEELLPSGIVKYNLSNLLVKVLLFAVQIYLISFSFKQYSISKHLKTINKHRQNGLDSYKLFVESISKEDTETRNSLMLQLAKAIYEQTSTGYISDKYQSVSSGIVEITKMIGANKLE